jgi:predicted nucleotidyltransferase
LDAERDVDAIRAQLEAEPAVRFALLFGSRAAGTARPDSDWDVAVYLDDALDAGARFRLRTQLAAALEPARRVDLVVLNDAPPLLAHRALLGERLFIRDRVAWVRFFVRTIPLALDDAYWNEIHAAARRRRLAEGRFGRP